MDEERERIQERNEEKEAKRGMNRKKEEEREEGGEMKRKKCGIHGMRCNAVSLSNVAVNSHQ